MTAQSKSAEIFELGSARARLRTSEIEAANFTSVGTYLEAVREALGLSINELSQKTHIKPQYLTAIETMSIDDLPAKPFAIGFARGFAEALGLDPDPVVERFKAEAGFSRVRTPAEIAEEKALEEESRSDQAPAERAELSLMAVIGIIGFIVWCAFSITRPAVVTTPVSFDALDDAAVAPPVLISPEVGIDAPLIPDFLPPRPLVQTDPVYPIRCEAGAKPIETVSVLFTVTETGRVSRERVANTTNDCFDRAALNAIRQWSFAPASQGGVATSSLDQARTFTFRRP